MELINSTKSITQKNVHIVTSLKNIIVNSKKHLFKSKANLHLTSNSINANSDL